MTRYAAALSLHPDAAEALGEVAGQLLERIGPEPDVAVVFASGHFRDELGQITAALRRLLAPVSLIGMTAVAVAGGGREIEDDPALSVWAADFDDLSDVAPVRLEVDRGDDGLRLVGWPDEVAAQGTLVLLADPLTFPADDFLRLVNRNVEGLRVIGGAASAAMQPGGNRLALDGAVHVDGAVGVMLGSSVPVQTVVSQGCRPVGRPFTVTRADGNLIQELGGRSPLERLDELVAQLSDDDRDRLQRGLHVGVVVDEHREAFDQGDFLVRGVVGAEPATGALAIGDLVQVGQTVQFHVRDAQAADADLRALLEGRDASGALLFTCNGRGTSLFGVADHDAGTVEAYVGPLPLAGAFCAGEFGPVGGMNHLHGFTASLALFD